MRGRRLHIIFASVLLGMLLWLSAVMRDQFQTTVSVPLIIQDVPEGRAISTPVPPSLSLKVRGDGWQLALLTLGSHPPLEFSLESLPGRNKAISANDVVDRMALRPGVELVSMHPDSIYLDLDRSTQKKVRVATDVVMSFREDYGQVGPITVTPESVTVRGAESLLRGLQSWKTARTEFRDLTASVNADVPLAASAMYLISFSPPAVRVGVQVDLFAEQTFSGLPVEIRSVPGNREVILLPPKIEIVVRTGIRQLSSLTPADFRVSVDYAAVATDTTGSADFDVAAPQGVQLVAKKPARLEYVIRKRL